MDIAGATSSNLSSIELQLSNGSRKKLTLSLDGSEISKAKSAALKNLASYECIICLYVHEKTLQTRCCQAVLCASCYLLLESPKRCPHGCASSSAAFSGAITSDLEPAGRLVDNQVARLAAEFNDIEPIESDHGKDAAKKQKHALQQLRSASVSAVPTGETVIICSETHHVSISSPTGLIVIGDNIHLAMGDGGWLVDCE